MVARQNLVVYQGADFRRALEFKDGAGALINLTGFVFRCQARVSHSDASPAFSFDFTVRDQADQLGVVDMHLPALSTQNLTITKETNYIYDIEMIDTTGDVRRILEGQIKLYPEVTK